MYKALYGLVLALFLGACEDKSYSKIYTPSAKGLKISALRISVNDPGFYKFVTSTLLQKEISVTRNAYYTLEVESKAYAKHCNNPMTSAYDATYDGYVRLRFLENMKLLYMCQKDYHDDLTPEILESLIDKMVDDLDIEIVPKR